MKFKVRLEVTPVLGTQGMDLPVMEDEFPSVKCGIRYLSWMFGNLQGIEDNEMETIQRYDAVASTNMYQQVKDIGDRGMEAVENLISVTETVAASPEALTNFNVVQCDTIQ